MKGKLFYDWYEERFCIKNNNLFSNTFHCGDCIEVFQDGKWVTTRFEMNSNGWYLVGLEHIELTPYTELAIREFQFPSQSKFYREESR